jgi:hypothetical protein
MSAIRASSCSGISAEKFSQTIGSLSDKYSVSSFLTDAGQIFDVARQGHEPEDFTIRISPESGVHIIAGSDYSYSSDTTYRVRRAQGKVVVEGRSGMQSCILQTDSRRALFTDRPNYFLQ